MKLTKGEFCQFNLKSRISLLNNDGMLLLAKKINRLHAIKLFLIYDFYIEVFYNHKRNKILKIEPIPNHKWIDLYLE